MDSLSPPQIQTCIGSSTSVRFCLQQPKQSEEPCASLLQAPSPRYGLWSLPHHQARRATSGSRVARRSRAFDSRELFSMTLEPCEVGFQAPPAAACGGQERPSGAERIPPRLASMINGNIGDDHRAPHPFAWICIGPRSQRFRADRTMHPSSPVCRSCSLALRLECRYDTYFELESVCAIAMRTACTHP